MPRRRAEPAGGILCVDVGSTFTKAVLVDPGSGTIVAGAQTVTTLASDVLDGVAQLREQLGASRAELLLCSSAGGGLRLAVVGFERAVTVEAGRRVALTAGAKVVHVSSGALDAGAVRALVDARPDVVLLVGGTDGGNADVLTRNGQRLATSRLPRRVPVVVAGNVEARAAVTTALSARGRPAVLAANVLPEIGVVAPADARAAIREAFLHHVIGGKGLSRGRRFADLVQAATPDTVLRGVQVLAAARSADVLLVDVGGATTDVYSSVAAYAADRLQRRDVVAHLHHARTVEGDLGVRWNAPAILDAALAEGLPVDEELAGYAAQVASDPACVPATAAESAHDLAIARLAALVAVRRHARAAAPGQSPRELGDVALVVGSGGVFRHAAPSAALGVLAGLTADIAGGWRTPRAARGAIDSAYRVFVVGLLADRRPELATQVAAMMLD